MDNVDKSVGKLGVALANLAIAKDCVAGSTGLEPAAIYSLTYSIQF